MRLGNSGKNGCAVPRPSSKEEEAIAGWFGQHGITRGATDTSLWWSMTPFSHHHTLRSGNPDTIYEGGIEFRVSAGAYRTLFPVATL